MKLTATAIKAASPREKNYDLRDDEVKGLLLRVGSSGSKSFAWRGNIKAAAVKVTMKLGDWGDITLDEARDLARECRRLAGQGIDPRAQRKRQEREARVEDTRELTTFETIRDDYLAAFERRETPTSRGSGPMSASGLKTERFAIERVIKHFAGTALADIDKKKAREFRDAHPDKSGSWRRQTYGAASRLMEFAAESGLVDENVFLSIRRPRQDRARSRRLNDSEIRAVWNATFALDPHVGATIRLLIAVPLRHSMAAGLRRDQVDGDLLRFDSTKVTDSWVVPMTAQAADIVKEQMESTSGDLLFPSLGGKRGTNRGGVYQSWGKAKVALDEASGVTDWVFHDFRRTIVSTLADRCEGYDEMAGELWLQHVRPGIRSVYQVSQAVPAMRRIAEMWSEELGRVLAKDDLAETVESAA